MISPRFVPALCVLVALTLVPTLIHSYSGAMAVDQLKTASIGTELAGYRGTPTARNEGWGRRRFESTDWFEREYRSGSDSVVLTVLRSYDVKRLYHHPELDVASGVSFDDYSTLRFAQRPEIPVHVLRTTTGRATALYVLHYDGAWVENPVRFQLSTAWELLFSRRKPMTLLFVNDLTVPSGVDPAELPSANLLFAAVDQFLAGS